MLSALVMPVRKKMLCVQKCIIRKCGGSRITIYRQRVTIRVIFFGSIGLDSSLASIFHVFYWWYNLKVVSVAIGYFCLLIESNFIVGLEWESEDLCKFLSITLSVLCFVEMKYLLLYHMDPVAVWLQLAQKLGCTGFLVFIIEEPAILSKGMQECNRNTGEVIATLACAYQYLHPEGPFVWLFLLFSCGFWANFTVEQLSSLIFFCLLPVISMKAFCRNCPAMKYASCCEEPRVFTGTLHAITRMVNGCQI